MHLLMLLMLLAQSSIFTLLLALLPQTADSLPSCTVESCHPLLTSSWSTLMRPTVAERRGAMCMHCLLSTAKTSRNRDPHNDKVNFVIVRVTQFLERFF